LPGNAARIGLNAWWAVQDAKPVEHTVRIECHTGTPNAKSFKVSQYTPDTVTIPDLESLFTIFDTIGDALKLGEKMGSSKGFGRVYPQEGIAIGKPSVDMECAWKEWTDWRAYFAFVIKLKMDPCITAYVKMFIPWPPPAVWVQTLLRKIGVNAGPYIRLEGGIGWNLDAERRSPDGDWGVSLTVSPFFGVRAGIEVSAGTKFYADASGQAKLTVPLKFYSPKLLRPLYLDVGQLKIASIKMVAVIAVSGGWAVDLAARAVGAKRHTYHGVEEGKVYGQGWDAGFSDKQTVYAADVELKWEDIKFFAPKTFNLLSA
jgi:hypothetical protein